MPDDFPRHLIRKLEKADAFPLAALEALRDLNGYLYVLERRAIRRASDLGASAEDIAESLGVTRQGAYYKLRALDNQTRRNARTSDSEEVSVAAGSSSHHTEDEHPTTAA